MAILMKSSHNYVYEKYYKLKQSEINKNPKKYNHV